MKPSTLLSRPCFFFSSQLKNDQGFTLIELLVVMIIIGILAALAIPSAMSQIGKARESEARAIIGALNRAQQSYMYEHRAFSPSANPQDYLDIPVGKEKYYDLVRLVPNEGVQYVHNNKNAEDNTRDYVGAVQYALDTRSFATIVCRVNKGVDVTNDTEAKTILNNEYGIRPNQAPMACQSNASELR